MTLSEALSAKIYSILDERNMTSYKLSRLSGLTQATLSDIRNKRNQSVSLKSIYAICQALDIELSDFFSDPYWKMENLLD